MKEIKGIKIPKLGFNPQKIGDLIYHEGPLLCLFIDNNKPDSYYLYKWADCDDQMNRWLVLPINLLNLKSFFEAEISLRTLFLNSPVTYITSLDDHLTEIEIMIAATSDLPDEYLPKEHSFYDKEIFTEFSDTCKTFIANNSIYDILKEILDEVNTLKKNQNSTEKLLRIMLHPQKKQQFQYQDSILYNTYISNYESQMSN